MKTRLLFATAALLGAIAVVWMGLDFIGSNALALAVTVVIGLVYILGLVELVQFRAATANLHSALHGAGPKTADELTGWLRQLHPSLQNAVSQRIQGERVGLPAPVFTPYLVGLLVMLGLLGTFIGMVDTLQGAVTALQGSTELSAIREGLAAPIKGLGLAFGTSVAGVAASAMLGLNSTLSRRERMQVTRLLDQCSGTVFKEHSLQYNRQQTYLAMQNQAQALPQVAAQLTAMAGELERMGNTLSEQLRDNQQQFHTETQAQYNGLAESVGASLRQSLAESGRLAGESIEPVVANTMTQLAAESKNTQEQLLAANQAHLVAIAEGLDKSTAEISSALGLTGEQFAENAKVQSRSLVEEIGKLLATTEALVEARVANEANFMEEQGQRVTQLTTALGLTGEQLAENARTQSREMVEEIGKLLAGTEALVEARAANESNFMAEQGQRVTQLTTALREQLGDLRDEEARRSESLGEQLAKLQASTTENLQALQASTVENLENLKQSSSDTLVSLHSSTSDSLGALQQSAVEQLGKLESSTSEHLASLGNSTTEQLSNLEASAAEQLSNLETSAAEQLARLGSKLEQPMMRLIETASETPRAAAEVIGKLREEVSNSLERDNNLLEERQALMQELAGLSQSLQRATESQQSSITDFVASSTSMLQSASEEFHEHLSGEASRLTDMTANVAGSAVEIASLGEAFGLAVQLFSESNQTLVENLTRIEDSMEKSSERSDEQMSYYVAQAREIIDQSMLSQREIIEELRRLGQTGDLFAEEAS